jgi:hypothetical protein
MMGLLVTLEGKLDTMYKIVDGRCVRKLHFGRTRCKHDHITVVLK